MNEFEQDILKMLQHTAKKDGFSDDFLDNVLLLRKTNPAPHAELKAQYARDVETCKSIDRIEAWQLWQERSELTRWLPCIANGKMWYEHLEYRRHPHADSIIAYHECSERDKKRWQFKFGSDWGDLAAHEVPTWHENSQYRLKPETITINGKEYAAPLRVAPENHTEYWYFLNCDYRPRKTKWDAMAQDLGRLAANNCFATEQDCQAIADAFNTVLRGDDND